MPRCDTEYVSPTIPAINAPWLTNHLPSKIILQKRLPCFSDAATEVSVPFRILGGMAEASWQKCVSQAPLLALCHSRQSITNNAGVVSSILTQAMVYVFLVGVKFTVKQLYRYSRIRTISDGNPPEKNVLLHIADDSMS